MGLGVLVFGYRVQSGSLVMGDGIPVSVRRTSTAFPSSNFEFPNGSVPFVLDFVFGFLSMAAKLQVRRARED